MSVTTEALLKNNNNIYKKKIFKLFLFGAVQNPARCRPAFVRFKLKDTKPDTLALPVAAGATLTDLPHFVGPWQIFIHQQHESKTVCECKAHSHLDHVAVVAVAFGPTAMGSLQSMCLDREINSCRKKI